MNFVVLFLAQKTLFSALSAHEPKLKRIKKVALKGSKLNVFSGLSTLSVKRLINLSRKVIYLDGAFFFGNS